jgi:hypothetical protein
MFMNKKSGTAGFYGGDKYSDAGGFAGVLGREVSANDMIPAIDKLVSANLIVRKGHGSFEIADPFVRHVWLQHLQMRQTLSQPETPQPARPSSAPDAS